METTQTMRAELRVRVAVAVSSCTVRTWSRSPYKLYMHSEQRHTAIKLAVVAAAVELVA